MICYKPLWKTLNQKGITKYQLVAKYGFSNGTIDRFRNNQHVSTYTIEKLCTILDCDFSRIAYFIDDSHSEDREIQY